MARITYVGPADEVEVPSLGADVTVKRGQSVDVDDDVAAGFVLQETWEPADKAAKAVHKQLLDDVAELPSPEPQPEPDPNPADVPAAPAPEADK